MWPFSNPSKVAELETKIEMMDMRFHYYVLHTELHKLQDLVCKHRNWRDRGITHAWHEVICEDCGKIEALSCEHGGPRACQECVDSFIREAKEAD